MGFIRNEQLADLMRSGRFQTNPTITVLEIGGGMGMPPEAVLGKNLGPKEPSPEIGVCWTADLKCVLEIAAAEGDNDKVNPNLSVLRKAFDCMNGMRETRAEGMARIEAYERAKILPFTPRPH